MARPQSRKNFIANIKTYGLAKTNRFEIEIPLPTLLLDKTRSTQQEKSERPLTLAGSIIRTFLGSGQEAVRGLSLMCEATEIPGISIATSELRQNSDTVHLPYGVNYQNHNFSFNMSRDMYEKNLIDAWIDLIIDRKTHKTEYYDNFVSDITIHQLDDKDNRIHSVILKEAYPIVTSAMPVSNQDRDTTHKLNVEFAYKRWVKLEEIDRPLQTRLAQTGLFPYISDALNDPVTRKVVQILDDNGLSLTGEAANIYNNISNVVMGSTGQSIGRLNNSLNEIKGSTNTNPLISSNDRTVLLSFIDGLLGVI